MSKRMDRFWSSLAVNLGKRAGLVSVIGLLITVTLGAGITRLEFTSGQRNWGYKFRLGLFAISDHDMDIIVAAMTCSAATRQAM